MVTFWLKDRATSSESIERMREVKKGTGVGRVVSQETRAKLSAAHKGKPISEETRAKREATGMRKKMSESHTGKIVSDQTRAKLSLAAKKQWERKKHELD